MTPRGRARCIIMRRAKPEHVRQDRYYFVEIALAPGTASQLTRTFIGRASYSPTRPAPILAGEEPSHRFLDTFGERHARLPAKLPLSFLGAVTGRAGDPFDGPARVAGRRPLANEPTDQLD